MAPIDKEAVCARIKEARIAAGLTQSEAAALLDVGPRTYQNYEADRVPWELLPQVAEITGRDLMWLLRGDDDETIAERERLMRVEAKLDDLLRRLPADDPHRVIADGLTPGAERERARLEALRKGTPPPQEEDGQP